MKKTSSRKIEHINICLEKEVESDYTGLENVTFIHNALPEINLTDVDTSVRFLGWEFSAPVIAASMTGGHPDTKMINRNIAIAVQELNLGMGVGSQRAAIEDRNQEDSFTVVRDFAPDAFIYANVGMPQVREKGIEFVERAVEMIDADAVAIHLNYLQEVIQPEGDIRASGCMESIKAIAREIRVPVIIKETGAGISRELAGKLKRTGISALDVGGKGGTSWSGVEVFRAGEDELLKELGIQFWDWGIPTAQSVVECSEFIPTIATGGIRTGIDVAKSLSLGASICSTALPILKSAVRGAEEVKKTFKLMIEGLKRAMFLTSCTKVDELLEVPLIITGRLNEILTQRGYDVIQLSRSRKHERTY